MTDNQFNTFNSWDSTSGEKPVINQEVDESYFAADPEKHSKKRKGKDADKTAENSKLAEGIRLFTAKRWADALQEFLLIEGCTVTSEEQAELVYYMGLCCTKLERFDDALLYFEQLISGGGNPLQIYQCRLILAFIYIKTGRAKMAVFELTRLQAAGFESAAMYNTLAYASYSQKQHLKAIEYYERALEIDSDNTTAMNSMGYILADKGISVLRGLRFCRKAVEKDPKNPAYLDSLGWALYKNGKIKEARSILRRALDMVPEEKEIKEHFKIVSGGV